MKKRKSVDICNRFIYLSSYMHAYSYVLDIAILAILYLYGKKPTAFLLVYTQKISKRNMSSHARSGYNILGLIL